MHLLCSTEKESPIGLEQHDRIFYKKITMKAAQIVQILGQMNVRVVFTGRYLFVVCLSSSLCQMIRKATSVQPP